MLIIKLLYCSLTHIDVKIVLCPSPPYLCQNVTFPPTYHRSLVIPDITCRLAVTNTRFAAFHGLPVVPVPLSTTPAPLRKSRARHERQWDWPQQRRASVCGSAAALRSGCDSLNAALRSPLHFPRSPAADRSRVKRCESLRHLIMPNIIKPC